MASRKGGDEETIVVIVVIVVLAIAGIGGKFNIGGIGGEPTAAKTENPTVAEAMLSGTSDLTLSNARDQLDTLLIAEPRPMSGYSRDRFPHWEKATENGWTGVDAACDAREAALIRDGANVKVGKSCSITGGSWVDPYTGTTGTTSSEFDIDHVVPLAAAWRSGASTWDDSQRQKYANDPRVLLTTGASANRSKGDRSPDQWTPTELSAQCGYAMRWLDIKTQYILTATAAEKTKLGQMLDTCKAS